MIRNKIITSIFFFLLIFSVASYVFGGQLEVTTFYPSPKGHFKKLTVAQSLQFMALPPQPEPCETGEMYFDNVAVELRFCDENNQWRNPDKIWEYDTSTNKVYLKNWAILNGVGIGVSNPTTMLDVANNNAIKVGEAYLTGSGLDLNLSNNAWYDGSWNFTGNGARIRLEGDGEAHFHRHAGGTFAQSMSISSGGNVAIGTTNYNQRLRVQGGSGQIHVELDPLTGRHISTKVYDDIRPEIESRNRPLASSVCPAYAAHGGTDGTQIRMRHGSGSWSSWIMISEAYCNPAPAL